MMIVGGVGSGLKPSSFFTHCASPRIPSSLPQPYFQIPPFSSEMFFHSFSEVTENFLETDS